MSDVIDIEIIGRGAIVSTDDVAFTFEATDNPREFKQPSRDLTNLDWTDADYTLNEWTVFPYGTYDDLPRQIKDVVQKNYIAPGILKKKTQLLWGARPMLYIDKVVDGKLQREWVEDEEIQAWLDSWDSETYLYNCAVDFHHIEAVNTKFIRNRGARLGISNKIAKLEHINPVNPRLARKSGAKGTDPSHCVFKLNRRERLQLNSDYKVYPLYDFTDPFRYPNSVLHSNLYSFCSDYYTVPDICGTLEWLRISTTVTLILRAMSKNSINVKYHIISPQAYWDKVKGQLQDAATEEKPYKDSQLIEFRKKVLRQISKVLSGAENTGKFWHSIKYFEIDGMKIFEHGWEIKEIKQNVKNFISAQETVSDVSNRAISASMGVHQAIGGSGEKGKTDGGGEQLYALKTYLATGIAIPEMIVCKALNFAIKANWPAKKIKMGFYHIGPEKEQDVTPKKRFKEQV